MSKVRRLLSYFFTFYLFFLLLLKAHNALLGNHNAETAYYIFEVIQSNVGVIYPDV